jgi:anti-sigma factor ChrR (cupin superfamily)
MSTWPPLQGRCVDGAPTGAGATLPPHRHVGDELIFLIEGANADESGVVATGNMNYRPNGCVHTVKTENGATVLAVVWGRTEPV